MKIFGFSIGCPGNKTGFSHDWHHIRSCYYEEYHEDRVCLTCGKKELKAKMAEELRQERENYIERRVKELLGK